MTLFEFHVELGRVADALEKIVFLLEKLVLLPPAAEVRVQQATLDDLHIVTAEDDQRMREEQQAFAARYCVVPGSEAFARELVSWEEDQRRIHGEQWQAPEDWQKILASAERNRSGREHPAPGAAQSAETPAR
jgi:hypothetical protein